MQNWKLEKLFPIPGFEQALFTIFEETIILFHDSLSLSMKMQIVCSCNVEVLGNITDISRYLWDLHLENPKQYKVSPHSYGLCLKKAQHIIPCSYDKQALEDLGVVTKKLSLATCSPLSELRHGPLLSHGSWHRGGDLQQREQWGAEAPYQHHSLSGRAFTSHLLQWQSSYIAGSDVLTMNKYLPNNFRQTASKSDKHMNIRDAKLPEKYYSNRTVCKAFSTNEKDQSHQIAL